MKKVMLKASAALFALSLSVAPLCAQDDGTYIDNFGPKDSSYTEESILDFDAEEEPESGSNTWMYIAIGAVVVIGVVVATRKKKK